MKRPFDSGPTYEKWGAYDGRRPTEDGRRLNRRLAPKRTPGRSGGLTRAQATTRLTFGPTQSNGFV